MSRRRTTQDRDRVCDVTSLPTVPAVEGGVRGPGGLRGLGGPGGGHRRYFVYCRKSSEAEERQVQSIQSQQEELRRIFGDAALEIVDSFEEARSAKSPGRPVFEAMMARIERGEADGIIAWAPDRLARNSIDGGRIVYLLDLGTLRDLKFATYTFENNSQGKFMLQIMFGQSKYYSDALSENVKRGNRTKAARGWRPNMAPLGYRNDPVTKTIAIDPIYFTLVRRMFDLVLSGGRSSREIARIAREDWGMRSPQRPRSGGRPIGTSSLHKMLTNPFYAGVFVWEGELHQGKHAPVLTLEDFRRVQELLRRPTRQHVRKNSFAFTGLIRCGACGATITAEHKTNRHGRRYIYYHCSRRSGPTPCREPSVRTEALEAQIASFVGRLGISPSVERWVLGRLERASAGNVASVEAVRETLSQALREAQAQISQLLDLRLRDLIGDEEFVARRTELQRTAIDLAQRLEAQDRQVDLIPPFRTLVSASHLAGEMFFKVDDETKRLILRTMCSSHPLLKGKILSLEAAKPFAEVARLAACPRQRAGVDTFTTPEALALMDSLTEEGRRPRVGTLVSALESQGRARPKVTRNAA
ncbi:recombinase family protein [Phenylobacterium aquaticum]|uniref:recombinase family protein n=1 Tax=Phenylobacterium aquaticum TaxID=1763816 RepID=UPI001F5C4BC1|nr:recombinase family protein [Phenylobacterium aquaticum]MCI3133124.1 recombinase family protein [Phenylobacterium aquaticum]